MMDRIKDSVTPRPTAGVTARITGLEARLLALLALVVLPWRRVKLVAKLLLAAERKLWRFERHNARVAVKREMLADPVWRAKVSQRLGQRRQSSKINSNEGVLAAGIVSDRQARAEIGFISPRRRVKPKTRRARTQGASRPLSRDGWLRGIVVWAEELRPELQCRVGAGVSEFRPKRSSRPERLAARIHASGPAYPLLC